MRRKFRKVKTVCLTPSGHAIVERWEREIIRASLCSLFPVYDATWPREIRDKWFDLFARLAEL